MKVIPADGLETLGGRRLGPDESFDFACHNGLACFNHCCRNLNLYLYPYDVLRLARRLGIGSARFIDAHVDVVLRPGHHFPDVLLRMAENAGHPCPYVSEAGCGVYADRPFTCRSFPLEKGLLAGPGGRSREAVYWLRPPAFCLGPGQVRSTTARRWFEADPDTRAYDRWTGRWARIQQRFAQDPWAGEGSEGRRAKMAFMAAYNLEGLRDFVFESSFLKRFKVDPVRLARIRRDDEALLDLGLDWIGLFLWGISGPGLRPRR
jgi:Fe-S-cluster containining protein